MAKGWQAVRLAPVSVILLGGTSWMGVSRLARAQFKIIDQREFVLAARGLGVHPLRVFLRHILPTPVSAVLRVATDRWDI